MPKILILTAALALPGLALAQGTPAANMTMQGAQMTHSMGAGQMHGGGEATGMGTGMVTGMGTGGKPAGVGGSPLSEPGQSAFAAIAEVVAVLEADPDTDWSTVDIDALRDHLRDMDVVTIDSHAVGTPIEGGMRFVVTGAPDVAPSIQRMVLAHARVMNGTDGWTYTARKTENGAVLNVTVPAADMPRLKALGFYGILASGMHHQPHHWMMATGQRMKMD